MKFFFKGFEKKAGLAQKITSVRNNLGTNLNSLRRIKQPKIPNPSMAIKGTSSMKI